jgi:hypothetical protein
MQGHLAYIEKRFAMAQVSKKFAEKVSTYRGGGLKIASAEGAGISRSQKSLKEGISLSDRSLGRLKRRSAKRV